MGNNIHDLWQNSSLCANRQQRCEYLRESQLHDSRKPDFQANYLYF